MFLVASLMHPCVSARAQTDCEVTESNCDGSWQTGPAHTRPGNGAEGGELTSCAWDPDGDDGPLPELLVIGGADDLGNALPREVVWTWDGCSWQSLPGVHGDVESIVVFNGQLIVGGTLTVTGHGNCGVAAWNGTSWDCIDPPGGDLQGVLAMTLHGDDLIAIGFFSVPNGGPRSIARWDGVAWSSVGGALLASRLDSVCSHAGDLYVSNVPQDFLARLDGDVWTPIGIPAVTPVQRLASHGGMLIAAGGGMTLGGGLSTLARWDGSQWTAWTDLATRFPKVLMSHGDTLYVGGSPSSPSLPTDFIARWDGAEWDTVGVDTSNTMFGTFDRISDLTIWNGQLVAVGRFAAVQGTRLNGIALIDGTDTWNPIGLGLWQYLAQSFATVDGALYVGGRFTSAGGLPADGLAVWDTDRWLGLGDGTFERVYRMAAFDGRPVCAGHLTGVPNADPRIAEWTGAGWTELAGPAGPLRAREVKAMVEWNGNLVVGGALTAPGHDPVFPSDPIVVWDGSDWSAALGSGEPGRITDGMRQVIVFDQSLVAVGDFRGLVPNAPTFRVAARWDGQQWTLLTPIGVSSDAINSVLAFDGVLYAVRTYSGLHRLVNGTWQPMPTTPPLETTGSGVSYSNLFSHEGAVCVSAHADYPALGTRVGLWRLDGVQWRGLGTFDAFVDAATGYQGDLFVGGSFETTDGLRSEGWARRTPSGLPWLEHHPAPTGVTPGADAVLMVVSRDPSGPGGTPTLQWRRNGVPLTDGPGKASPGGGNVTGSQTTTLTIAGARGSDGGMFDLIATNSCGSITSMTTELRVGLVDACPGDLNGDKVVDRSDFMALAEGFGIGPGASPEQGDVNNDGFVNATDFTLFVANYGCIQQ